MSDTTYVDFVQPAVNAEWLNEVNDHVWHDTPVQGTSVHDAASISNTPAGTLSSTNMQDAINELDNKQQPYRSLFEFGAVGDGVVDDSTAIQNALNSQCSLVWIGSSGRTFRILTSLSIALTTDCTWHGEGATVVYDGSHAEYAIQVTTATANTFLLNDLTIDGGKKCNNPLKVFSSGTMTNAATLLLTNVFATRAKRSNAFNGGNGMWIYGAFDSVTFNGGGASDCELPTGQGTPSVVGITGITVTVNGTTGWARRCIANGITIDKVYSSDLAYQSDQDGLRFFAPDDLTVVGGKPASELVVTGGSVFRNCYGRSIKTQCRNTVVRDSYFERTEGLTSGQGNVEIDAQTGTLSASDLTFSYANGQEPFACVRTIGDSTHGKHGMSARDCVVYTDSATTITTFAQAFCSAGGLLSRHSIDNIQVFGKTKAIAEFLCNGEENYADVANCYISELVNGVTSEKALIYILSAGTSPYYANITAHGNVYDNTGLPAIARDTVPSNSMNSSVSAWNNIGFSDVASAYVNAAGLKTAQAFAVGKVTSEQNAQIKGYHQILTENPANGATATFPIRRFWSNALIFIQAGASGAYAFVSSSDTTNVSIAASASFVVGNAANPGSGTYRVWSSGTNELSVQNNSGSSRPITVFIVTAG